MSFPRSLPTELQVIFYRFPERAALQSNIGMSSVTEHMVDSRYPTPYMKNIYEYTPMTGKTINPWFIDTDTKSMFDKTEPTVYQEPVEWHHDELKLYLESTYPVGSSWKSKVIAVLPEVEVPEMFSKHTPELYVAVNHLGELGFVNLELQTHLQKLPFDYDINDNTISATLSAEICIEISQMKAEAEKAGWELVECTNVLTHIKTSRIDDGKYDHKTYSFYPGTRCGWCGSSSIRPFFIGEAQCIACHCKLDAIEPRDNLNLSDDWL